MSAPAQKTLPAPVRITARTSSISPSRSNIVIMSSSICSEWALTGGLSMRTTAMWSSGISHLTVSRFSSNTCGSFRRRHHGRARSASHARRRNRPPDQPCGKTGAKVTMPWAIGPSDTRGEETVTATTEERLPNLRGRPSTITRPTGPGRRKYMLTSIV